MKATLTFTLPEEQEEFQDAQDGSKVKAAAQDFNEYLRQQLKYNGNAYTQAQTDVLIEVRKRFYEYFEGLLQ